MRRLLRTFITRFLATGDIFPTGMTDRNELRGLIQRLHPVSSQKELIRLGPQGEGGYLVPDDLTGIEACFSPGVSQESGFERDCAELGILVFLADRSVEQPTGEHELFHFTRKHIGVTSNDDFMTLDDWVKASLPGPGSDLLLQIDVEGYEYEVFLSISSSLMQRFRIIVAEFHHLDKLWSKPFFQLAGRAFDKILQTHACVHIHPNNCCGSIKKRGLIIPRFMEFTFLRKERVLTSSYQKEFPHPLDRDNTGNPPLPLPSCWYDQG